MIINRSLFRFACRMAAFSFLVAGTTSLMQAQQSASTGLNLQAPLFLASESAPAALASTSLASSSSSSSSDAVVDSDGQFMLNSAALLGSQPPPRRYGRPNYSDSHSNPDGSEKYVFQVGAGLSLPLGDTHRYDTPSYSFQVGGGRNFNKSLGVTLLFDYDHFGLQGATLANQTYIYNYGCTAYYQSIGDCALVSGLDGNSHVWSFSLNPTYTLSGGAYIVVGAGFYHKVTNFEEPTEEEECTFYGCGDFEVDANIDHYTSNAPGFSGGFGLTHKISHFSNEQLFMEARYVFMMNSQRYGYTSQNVATTSYNGYDAYPANSNRTTYIPINFGIRF